MSDLNGREVIQQAADNSVGNTEPALVRGAVVGVVTVVGSILVLGGYIDESQKQSLIDNIGVIIPAVFAIAAVVQAFWTRFGVYSPRSAAKIAVLNASPATIAPTLAPPP